MYKAKKETTRITFKKNEQNIVLIDFIYICNISDIDMQYIRKSCYQMI